MTQPHPLVLWRCWLGGRKGIQPVKKYGEDGGGWHWLVRMEWSAASVNLPLHHKVQKFSSGTGSPGWSPKRGRKTIVVVVVVVNDSTVLGLLHSTARSWWWRVIVWVVSTLMQTKQASANHRIISGTTSQNNNLCCCIVHTPTDAGKHKKWILVMLLLGTVK